MFRHGCRGVSFGSAVVVQRVAESWIAGIVSAGLDVLGRARGARESAVGSVGRSEKITGGGRWQGCTTGFSGRGRVSFWLPI